MMKQRKMGAEHIAFGRKIGTTLAIGPCKISVTQQR